MRSYLDGIPSQVREGVELWEVGAPLGGVGARPLIPPTALRTTATISSAGSDTSSSGGSCSSSSCSLSQRRLLSHPWSKCDFRSVPPGLEEDMSLKGERHLLPSSPDGRLSPVNQSLTRSRSFGGLLMTPSGARRSIGGGTILRPGWSGQGVLGQGVPPPSPRDLRRMNSLPPYVKVPKTPRPERASILSCAVARGLKDSIAATRHDLMALRKAQQDYRMARSQGRVYEMDKQIKGAERYLKKLEFLLSQVEDLHDQYSLNQRLRDGVRTMAYAYALSPGKEKASALSNVRSGYKECTETLCSLEVQIEQLIGTLVFEMKGIQGFARLCPGDVFEVVIKHGSQKWKTRGRINKDNSQTWDNSVYMFKGLIGEMLQIKAMEVRLLGKTVTIGSKICETKDLFAPHPQLMTVNLNPSGSLKLNLIITWNPLVGGTEETLTRTPSMSRASPRGRKKSVIPSLSSSPPQYQNFLMPSCKDLISPECDHDSSFGSMSARSSTTDSASPLSEYRDLPSSQAALSTRTDSNSPISDIQALVLSQRTDSHDSIIFDDRDSGSPNCDESGNFTLVRKEESRVAQWARYSQYNGGSSQGSQLDIMSRSFPNLSTHLQSMSSGSQQSHRFSPVLPHLSYSLSHQLNLLAAPEPEPSKWTESLGWDCTVPNSLPKVITRLKTCLEDIQGQFPQLHCLEEAVLDLHDMCRHCRSRRDSNTSEISLSVESALECFDFLNAECDDDFGDDDPEKCLVKNQKEESLLSLNKDPLDTAPPLVTDSPQLDTFLLVHLKHSLQLMPDLGKYGPLRMKEKESLSKLQREGNILSKVLEHRNSFDELKPQRIVPLPHTQVLWDSVVSGDNWCTTGKEVVDGLKPIATSLVECDSEGMPIRVLEELVRQITDSDIYSDCLTVTVGHFIDHLYRPIQDILPELASTLTCVDLLQQADAKCLEEALNKLEKASFFHTKLLSHLVFNSSEMSQIVVTFLKQRNEQEDLLLTIYDGCLLLLESVNPVDRSSACELIGHLVPYLPNSCFKEPLSPFPFSDHFKNNFPTQLPLSSTAEVECAETKRTLLDKQAKDNSNKDQQKTDQLNKRKEMEESSSSSEYCDQDINCDVSRLSQEDNLHKQSNRNSRGTSSDSQPILILSHIHQNDHSEAVRESARLALMNLGALATTEPMGLSHSLSHSFTTPQVEEVEETEHE